MRKLYVAAAIVVAVAATSGGLLLARWSAGERLEQERFERGETQLVVANESGARLRLYKAGKNLQDAAEHEFDGRSAWLPPGNYFLEAALPAGATQFYPVPVTGYRSGPDEDGAFNVTVRPPPATSPPRLLADSPEFAYIPSGHFLIGDRLNKQEPHHVWLTGFFISRFEVTNAEFRAFIESADGYRDDANWCEAGRRWKAANATRATALLQPSDTDFKRFGQPDQPVVFVNWYEANAFCRWLTTRLGGREWVYSLPNDAEWEKAARGPDGFDYGLGASLSDAEVRLYNWKKNPGAEVTVVGLAETPAAFVPNRYGVYHLSGNASEWTQSVYRAYSRRQPYTEDERNHDDTPGQRVVRGGSWYSASIAILYLPYRETFPPEVGAPYLGFRVVAKLLN
jgi:iron(II)-dependent oxidoreductase